MTAPWWAVLGTSQLHSTLSRQKAHRLVSTSTEASPSSVPRDCDASLSPLPPEVPVTRAGFCFLGCPICPPSFCEQVLQDRVVKIREALGVLLEMGDAQMETTPLRSCFALSKFSYLLCTCPPTHISKATVDFDVAMREALESILGGPLSGWSWLKASLPMSVAVGESPSGALSCMPLLPSWRLPCTPSHWLGQCLRVHLVSSPIQAPRWLPSLQLHPDQTGNVWRT